MTSSRQTLIRFERRSFLISAGSLGIGACLGACGCRTAPITGRRQLLIMPETEELSLGAQTYGEVVAEAKESQNQRYKDLVSRVGNKIAAVANRDDYQWEFKTLASDEQNAFCLPGGKVAIYEGILPVCQNEAGLAVVMSHEIGHSIARHGGERMSQDTAVQGVKNAVGYVMRQQDEVKRAAVMKAYGLASEYGVLLPYSRKHELEADHIGLMLMSQAGYEPEEAPRFWQRFGSAVSSAQKPPAFMSTHPSDEQRSSELTKLLPQAKEYYVKVANPVGMGEII